MPRRAAWLLCLLLLPLAAADARAESVELHTPRAFGYFIGDAFAHEAFITLAPGYALERSSLPTPRSVTYWLDLTGVELEDLGTADGGRRYRLHLRYQTFYAPLEPRALTTPPVTLVARNGEARQQIQLPAWTFLSSPLREIVSSGRGGDPMALQPDVPPAPYGLAADARLAAAAAGLAALSLCVLAALRGWGPFARRRHPFVTAARRIRRVLGGDSSAGAYTTALRHLHRAFDATAGYRLLADDVPGFLAQRPRLSPEAEGIGRFFAASRLAFFGTATEHAMASLPTGELDALARRLAAAERAGAGGAP